MGRTLGRGAPHRLALARSGRRYRMGNQLQLVEENDRMVAFHIVRGARVPLSASEFYAGLNQRLPKRDGMFFLPAPYVFA